MSSAKKSKRKKKTVPIYARRLERFHEDIARTNTRERQLRASRDDTRLSIGSSSAESAASAEESSSGSQAIMLQIPTSPKKSASTRFNIRDVMRNNTMSYTAVADNAKEEDDSEDLNDEELERRGAQEEADGFIDADNADEVKGGDNEDDDSVALPSEARIEEIVEIFGGVLRERIGDYYKERITEMYTNNETSKLYALLKDVAGDELLRGIDTAARPAYDLDDPMDIETKQRSDDEDADSIEEEAKEYLRKAEKELRKDASNVEMQDAFEKVVHDTLDRKKRQIEDRDDTSKAWIYDIANNALGDNIEDVIAKLTIPNLKAHITKKHSYLARLFKNPGYEAAIRKIYSQTVLIAALHLRTFTRPETRPTLNLAWALFYGSMHGKRNQKTGIVIPATRELGFEPKGDQISVATTIFKEIECLDDECGFFTHDLNDSIDSASPHTPGADFFRTLRSTDYNASVRFVPHLECPDDCHLRCAVSGEPLKAGDSVYACRFLSLRMADQSLIPPTFRGSASWQNHNYRDVFRLFYIKQHIMECPPQFLRESPLHTPTQAPPAINKKEETPNTGEPTFPGMGLSCWKEGGSGGNFYLRYSALLEKILSFRGNVYRKSPTTILARISKLAKDPTAYFELVESIDVDDLRSPKSLGTKIRSIAAAIGNKNAYMSRDILAACFCSMENGNACTAPELPSYMGGLEPQPYAPDVIETIVKISNRKSKFISIFCRPNQSQEEYDRLLSVGKGLLGAKPALPALLTAVKIVDLLFSA